MHKEPRGNVAIAPDHPQADNTLTSPNQASDGTEGRPVLQCVLPGPRISRCRAHRAPQVFKFRDATGTVCLLASLGDGRPEETSDPRRALASEQHPPLGG